MCECVYIYTFKYKILSIFLCVYTCILYIIVLYFYMKGQLYIYLKFVRFLCINLQGSFKMFWASLRKRELRWTFLLWQCTTTSYKTRKTNPDLSLFLSRWGQYKGENCTTNPLILMRLRTFWTNFVSMHVCMNTCTLVCIFNPSARAGCDVRSIFKVWTQNFPSPRPVAILKLKSQSALLFVYSWKENSWIHTFSKGI